MFSRSSRKPWLLITIFLFLLHFFFPLFFRRVKGKRISMVVVKNHAFLLDPPTVHPKLRNNLVLMVLNICIPLLSAHSWCYLWVSWSSSFRFHYVHWDIWLRKRWIFQMWLSLHIQTKFIEYIKLILFPSKKVKQLGIFSTNFTDARSLSCKGAPFRIQIDIQCVFFY